MGPKRGRNPPPIVYAQVNLYPRYDICEEGGRNTGQHPQVEQVIGNSKEKNTDDENW